MQSPLPLPETGGVYHRDPKTGALAPASAEPSEPASETPIAPEADTPAPLKKDRRNG